MRVAVWQRVAWVEIQVEHFEESREGGVHALSIIGTLEPGAKVEEPAAAAPEPPQPVETGKRATRTRTRMRKATAAQPIAPAPPAPLEPPPPAPPVPPSMPPPPPTWGGRDPKDVDGETKPPEGETPAPAPAAFALAGETVVRFFTVTLSDGKVLTNQCTSKGSTVAEAEDAVRRTWTKLGKKVVKCVHQAHGRVGEDTPVVAVSVAVDEDTDALPRSSRPADDEDDEGPRATMFRWYRSDLQDSMATAVPCHTLAKLIEILRTCQGLESVTADKVNVDHYAHDDRVGWDTYTVVVNGSVVGMTNGKL